MQPKKNETSPGVIPPTQIRFTDDDKARIAEIRRRFGLKSIAGAVRFAIVTVSDDLAMVEKKREKIRKSS